MRIVVGVDGSDGSAAALRWAVAEAEARSCPVVALLAYGFYGRPQQVQDRTGGWNEEALSAAAADLLHETVTAETGGPRGTSSRPVTTMVAGLEPVEALLEVATDDDVLVLGSRGLGTMKRLLLGSTSAACARYASRPVVVVRSANDHDLTRPVLVGFDGSRGALAALDWALRHASARRAPLHVVRAWSRPEGAGVRMPDIVATADLRERTEKQLHELVGEHTRGADVPVTAELVDGRPAATLIEVAAEAGLLVVGSRGVGGFTRLLLGSTSATCLLQASTNVAVIHDPDSAAGGAGG